MVTVECKECPIRNFCKVCEAFKEGVFYDKCPLFKCAQSTREFFSAEEKLESRKRRGGLTTE